MQCLSTLASKPERIMKLIKTTEVNSAGCYVIQLCINGIWEDIVVDDFLPIVPGSNNIAFGHSRA